MEMSKQSRLSDNFNYLYIGRILICILLVFALLLNCTQVRSYAIAEIITLEILISICLAASATYGIIFNTVPEQTLKEFLWNELQKAAYNTYTSVMVGATAVYSLTHGLWLNEEQSEALNGIFNIFKSNYGLTENMVDPITVSIGSVGSVIIRNGVVSGISNNSLDTVLTYLRNAGVVLYGVPYSSDVNITSVSNGTNKGLQILINNNSIATTRYHQPLSADILYAYCCLGSNNYLYWWAVVDTHNANNRYECDQLASSIPTQYSSYLESISAIIPGTYVPAVTPAQDQGTLYSYAGQPVSGTLEDWAEGVLDQYGTDTLVSTRTEDIPEPVEPVPVPETTTWEDGALEFWQSIGGAITGGLSTAGQSVRQWIQSLHLQMVEYWEALLEWCDGIVGAIEGAEDGFIRGIINEISTVFGSVKSTLRSALGIWHYVVDWLRSIGAPFNLFLGLAGRVSPYITLPIYASIAGLVILGVYKKFIG